MIPLDPGTETFLTLNPRNLPIVLESRPDSPSPDAIEGLTRGLAAGREDAFREFHRLYFDRLYHFLLGVARGEEEPARDALQETLLRVNRSARVFRSEEVFWCWLKAVARNVARDAGRKHRRHLDLLRRFAGLPQTPPSEPHEGALAAALDESLAELSQEERDLIEARYLNGETVRELSAGLDSTEKAVESRLLRLRRRLKEEILRKLRVP